MLVNAIANDTFNPRDGIIFEDAQIIFKNFSGNETMYNQAGKRNFNVVLSPEDARIMADWGFNPRIREAREEGEENLQHIKVNLNFDSRIPPILFMVDGDRRPVQLTESTIGQLDGLHIKSADLKCNAYSRNRDGNYTLWLSGPSYFVVDGDRFAYKYGGGGPVDEGFDDPF